MKNRTESKSYMDFANNLVEQFEHGENVDAGDIVYLKGFSPDSRIAHDYLMDRIADMYGVTPLDSLPEKVIPAGLSQKVGRFVLSHLEQ
jgi:hypothetical protein